MGRDSLALQRSVRFTYRLPAVVPVLGRGCSHGVRAVRGEANPAGNERRPVLAEVAFDRPNARAASGSNLTFETPLLSFSPTLHYTMDTFAERLGFVVTRYTPRHAPWSSLPQLAVTHGSALAVSPHTISALASTLQGAPRAHQSTCCWPALERSVFLDSELSLTSLGLDRPQILAAWLYIAARMNKGVVRGTMGMLASIALLVWPSELGAGRSGLVSPPTDHLGASLSSS